MKSWNLASNSFYNMKIIKVPVVPSRVKGVIEVITANRSYRKKSSLNDDIFRRGNKENKKLRARIKRVVCICNHLLNHLTSMTIQCLWKFKVHLERDQHAKSHNCCLLKEWFQYLPNYSRLKAHKLERVRALKRW